MQHRLFILVAITLLLGAAHADVRVDQSTVNKGLHVQAEQSTGDLSSVNGGIEIGDGAEVGSVESVNGGIRIGSQVRAGAIESVNGTVRIGSDSIIDGSLSTVNGTISSQPGVSVLGEVSSVNGAMDLQGTTVDADVVTYNGAIRLGAGTLVNGDIHVRKSRNESWGWFGKKERKPVRVEIDGDATVAGDLHFERPVRLRLHEGARIGEIHGDEVEIERLR